MQRYYSISIGNEVPESQESQDIAGEAVESINESIEAPSLKDRVIEAIKEVYDPEIPVDIYELGLIYEVKPDEETGHVIVVMTLTTPGCFAAGQIPGEVEQRVLEVEGVKSVYVDLTFDPPWDKHMMSEAARLELGFW